MKKIIIIAIIVVLVVIFGSFPLSVLAKIFDFLGKALGTLAKWLNFFGWNGLIKG